MEKKHEEYFANNFMHRYLHQVFVKGQSSSDSMVTFRSTKEFEYSFKEVMNSAKQSTNKYHAEYKTKLEREM